MAKIENEKIKVYKLSMSHFNSCMFDDKRLLIDEFDLLLNECECGSKIAIDVIEMTRGEFENLSEFQGY